MDSEEDMMSEEMDFDDAELQMAIALSMGQQPGGAEPGQAGQQGGAPAAGGAADAAALQQALQQAMQQVFGQGPAAPQPHQPQAVAPGANLPQEARASAAPTWVQLADSWMPRDAPPTDVTLPSGAAAAGEPLQAATSKALGCGVAYAAPGAASAEPVTVQLAAGPDGGARLSLAAVQSAAAGLPAGGNLVLSMQQCWLRAAEALAAGPPPPEVAAALALWQWAVAGRASAAIQSDGEEDLFFQGGDDSRQFVTALEGGQVSPAFLDAMVRASRGQEDAAGWEKVLREGFEALKAFDFLRPEATAGAMARLNVLTQSPALRRCLAALLVREARDAARLTGKVFEAASILGPLLSISTLPTLAPGILPLAFPAKECFTQLRGYPTRDAVGVETEYNAIRRALASIYEVAHEVVRRIATLKPGDSPLRGREVVPAWLAAAAGLNLSRAEAGSYIDRVLHHRPAIQHASGDGFMIGVLSVCLRFCRPFLAGAAKKEGALAHLNPSFYASQLHRLEGVRRERTLAGAMPAPLAEGARLPYPYLSPDRGEGEGPHFVAELFFLTQRMIHVGLMPTVYRVHALDSMLSRRAGDDGSDDEDQGHRLTLEQHLLSDGMRAQVLDPDLANDLVQYAELTARWLLGLLRAGDAAAQRAAFSLIPESVVREMAAWLSTLIRYGSTELLGGMDIGALMSCVTGLLARPDLVPNPLVHDALVQLLLAMLSPQLGGGRTRGLARAPVSPAEAALVSAVLGSGAAQTELLPALMTAYVHADHVVGLDVDREQYDKFTMRHAIDALLMELWRDPTCAASLTRLAEGAAAGSTSSTTSDFSDFVGAVLNDLLYLLKDSLHRLEDIHGLEASMADEAAWAALPPRERADKQAFYKSQQRAARGFMGQAVSTLRMLNTLTADPAVQRAFLHEPIATRAAAAAVHFLDLLVGPTCTRLEVARPEQYRFDPDALLLGTTQFLLRLAGHASFVGAVAAVPDYEEGVMRGVLERLAARSLGEYEHRLRLEALIEGVAKVRAGRAGAGGAGGAALDLSLPTPEVEGVEEAYVATMTPLSLGVFDSGAPRAYNRAFAALADAAAGDTSAKMKALSKEMRNLGGRTALPVHAASSIFVRHDGDRMDKVRALITGPEGTPYAGGCFVFDVFFPPDYPAVPPLMELETTGGGVARYNPNLYADGKVCLSLLGTWHGGAASEKWQPGASSLFQVLLSIQGMIFIEDPYFNEPAYDGMRGTAEGAASSLKYNAEIWLNNIRYAMLDMIRNPRPGYEDVVAAHFRLLRHRILRQVGDWLVAAQALDPTFQRRLADAAAELRALLATL